MEKFIGAGIAMIGVLGTGLGQGVLSAKYVEAIARNPDVLSQLRINFIVASAVIETGSLYCFVISILLVFVV